MSCELRRGTNNHGTVLAETTYANTFWVWLIEDTSITSPLVDTANYAYAVTCSSTSTSDTVIGAVRIRYTVTGPG